MEKFWQWVLENIIGIISLIVTGVIGIMIPMILFRIEIKKEAKKFIYTYLEEIRFLTLAQLSNYLYPQKNHCRKMYNDFNSREESVRKKILKLTNEKKLRFYKVNQEDFVKQLLDYYILDYYIDDVKECYKKDQTNYKILKDFVVSEQNSIYTSFKYIVGNSYKQSNFNKNYDRSRDKITFEDITKLINKYYVLEGELSALVNSEELAENYSEEYSKKSAEQSYIVGRIIKDSLQIMHKKFYEDLLNNAVDAKKLFTPNKVFDENKIFMLGDLDRLEDFYYFIILHLYFIYHSKLK